MRIRDDLRQHDYGIAENSTVFTPLFILLLNNIHTAAPLNCVSRVYFDTFVYLFKTSDTIHAPDKEVRTRNSTCQNASIHFL